MFPWWLWWVWSVAGAEVPEPVDVAIIPGCPTLPDGRLSECQWRRAVWAAHLYEEGLARHFITSGGAAYTPYVEATSIAMGLEALGVPAAVVFRETQALHTDQNTGYALVLADRLGFRSVGMASDPGHSDAMCRMATRWGRPCTNLPMDYEVVSRRMAELPSVLVEPISRDRWIADHREPRMATSANYRSVAHYTGVILKAALTGSRPPKPPGPEPTLELPR
jgi:hypothetical protein